MPNTFAPRAYEKVVKETVQRLRLEYDGSDADIKEWHAMLHIADDEATEAFLEEYSDPDSLPGVIDGVNPSE